MSARSSQMRYATFVLSGLGAALVIAAMVSPFASPNPDGLNRVAEDLGFTDREHPEPAAQKLPFADAFDGYALRGVPEQLATPMAGAIGVLVTFGLAWVTGKLLIRRPDPASTRSSTEKQSHD